MNDLNKQTLSGMAWINKHKKLSWSPRLLTILKTKDTIQNEYRVPHQTKNIFNAIQYFYAVYSLWIYMNFDNINQ